MSTLPSKHHLNAGFTLLEVLIALSIFALIGVASFNVLTTVIDTQRVGDEHSNRLSVLQRAILVLDRDISQQIQREIRISGGKQLDSLLINSDDFPIELTRGGWSNPLQSQRSELQRVAYRVGSKPLMSSLEQPEDTTQYLLRVTWPHLDRSSESEMVVQPILPGVEAVDIRAITDKGRLRQWPPKNSGSGKTPELLGIELTVTLADVGPISRVYKVR